MSKPNTSLYGFNRYELDLIAQALPELYDGTAHRTKVCALDVNKSHGNTCTKVIEAGAPDTVDSWYNVINFPTITNIVAAGIEEAQAGAEILNASMNMQGSAAVSYDPAFEWLRENGVIWLDNKANDTDYPYPVAHKHDNILLTVPIRTDGTPRGVADPERIHVAVYQNTLSFGTPVPGALICMLKALAHRRDMELTYADYLDLLYRGCEHTAATEPLCKYGLIGFRKSIELLLGKSLTSTYVLVPEPAPEPDADIPSNNPEPIPEEPVGEEAELVYPTEIEITYNNGSKKKVTL